MFRKGIKYFLIILLISVLFGCELLETESGVKEEAIDEVTALEDLEDIDFFRSRALEHILEGELNKKGQAVGFHYDRLPSKKGEIIRGTETKPNEFGVYEAEVVVSDVEKTSNNGKSTFFPDELDSQEVVDAINEAYEERVFISGNTYEGLTKDGIVIRMYLDNQEKIISAFPIY